MKQKVSGFLITSVTRTGFQYSLKMTLLDVQYYQCQALAKKVSLFPGIHQK